MAFTKKTPLEKLETKIKNLVTDARFVKTARTVKFEDEKLFDYNKNVVKYGYKRCYISKVEPIASEDYKVTILLNEENLTLLSSNITNPPQIARTVIELFRKSLAKDFDTLVIGNSENKIIDNTVFITKELYNVIGEINKEEAKTEMLDFSIVQFLS